MGIQVADVIAGFNRRYLEDIQDQRAVGSQLMKAQRILMTMNNENVGAGINMVMAPRDNHWMKTPRLKWMLATRADRKIR